MKLAKVMAFGALGIALLVGDGCVRRSALQTDPSVSTDRIHRPKRANEKITEYDLNRDLKPDAWDYTVAGKDADGQPTERHVRKELDVNWDGKVDLVYDYDEKGRVSQATFDLDFDGHIDQVNLYEGGVLIRKERDLDYNGKIDEWVYYEHDKVIRKERDTNNDGRVDYWEYWEGDQVDRVGEDIDGDGKVDRWTKNSHSDS
jgi:hypothetical protein